jgi:hypothetical protein
MALSITTLSMMGLVKTLSINDTQHNSAECQYDECGDFLFFIAECRYAECRYAEFHYAECRGALKNCGFKGLTTLWIHLNPEQQFSIFTVTYFTEVFFVRKNLMKLQYVKLVLQHYLE